MVLYLTRHGQTIWNLEHRAQGWQDSPLTELGRKQAENLALRLKKMKLDIIYSSPLGRAADTSSIIANMHDNRPDIIKSDLLKEIGLGALEGMTKDDQAKLYAGESNKLWNDTENYIPVPGSDIASPGETYAQLFERVGAFVDKLINDFGDTDTAILVVSHAVTLKAFLAVLENRPIKDVWSGAFIDSACFNHAEYRHGGNGGEWHILIAGDMSHHDTQL